jgi:hypothetical protein
LAPCAERPLYSDLNGAYSRAYFGLLPDEIPALNVFTVATGLSATSGPAR